MSDAPNDADVVQLQVLNESTDPRDFCPRPAECESQTRCLGDCSSIYAARQRDRKRAQAVQPRESYLDGQLDITGAEVVGVEWNAIDGVLWVNVEGKCRLRICRIKHLIVAGIEQLNEPVGDDR